MLKTIHNRYFYTGLLGVAILVVVFFILPSFLPASFVVNFSGSTASSTVTVATSTATTSGKIIVKKPATHLAPPKVTKGIYMTACVAATPSFRAKLVKLINETELNSVVLDIKDYTGTISFKVEDPKFSTILSAGGGGCTVADMVEFVEALHKNNIYVIGRITAFQDPHLAKLNPEWAVKRNSDRTVNWKDRKGISYIDAGNKDMWKYLADLSKASYDIGFDEINFDYIRFPSDGDMKDIYFPWSNPILVANATSTVSGKSRVLKGFFEYLHENLGGAGIPISADLFGMTCTNYDDLNIGQVLEDAAPNFDYIDPMVYPSHYPPGFMNYNSVAAINAHPYEIVKFSMDVAVKRLKVLITPFIKPAVSSTTAPTVIPAKYSKVAELRPWLQDNDYPVPYSPAMVRAQIQATYDSGLTSWLLWDAANTYTAAALNIE